MAIQCTEGDEEDRSKDAVMGGVKAWGVGGWGLGRFKIEIEIVGKSIQHKILAVICTTAFSFIPSTLLEIKINITRKFDEIDVIPSLDCDTPNTELRLA